ncbi:hypothetical protein SODALDRAFT_379127 [Sodiomyces alkalinus F11]|uniref:Uncharacterized protein n=1 Tax=Sodiomyces alkalinus (strain CBS 110278 / VKM F-3762 / F11) TaxID=1314773 RepID=A0A3N2PTP3_SODAK|nr:hypothetical protein SODALDRAFT_379127 [Sodiomyces alkalinus F11]ROT37877.1 hypothetical protein SODALDRAFT_379127 [Sodiomyces alkalinus F11]
MSTTTFPPPAPPSPPPPPPTKDHPLVPPSPPTIWIADNWPSIIGCTVLAHVGHYRYLTTRRKPSPNPIQNARFWAIAGGGWMVAYLSVITAVAVSRAKVNHYRDPETRGLYSS